MNKKDELIFWLDTPPKVSKGAYNYVSKVWENKVYYVCNFDYPEYRKKVNWNDGDFGKANVIILQGKSNQNQIIEDLFVKNPNAIHVLSGVNNSIERNIRNYTLSGKYKVIMFSERPVEIGNWFEKVARLIMFRFKYTYFHWLYKDVVKAFLPLGRLGVETFSKYGWPQDVMFPFMYNPESHNYNVEPHFVYKGKADIVNFLYVGRFYYKTKGVDILMRAAEKLRGRWKLDMVGGYGAKSVKVKEWIQTQPNVTFLGSWPSEEVSPRMQDYDVIVVPSRYDGWNLLVNEAINAGVGVITTNHAVSDEVVSTSGAGIVVKANNVKAFADAMQYVIDNPNIIPIWKKKAVDFMPRISSEVVGNYFIQILDYTFYNELERPKCPWLDDYNV